MTKICLFCLRHFPIGRGRFGQVSLFVCFLFVCLLLLFFVVVVFVCFFVVVVFVCFVFVLFTFLF